MILYFYSIHIQTHGSGPLSFRILDCETRSKHMITANNESPQKSCLTLSWNVGEGIVRNQPWVTPEKQSEWTHQAGKGAESLCRWTEQDMEKCSVLRAYRDSSIASLWAGSSSNGKQEVREVRELLTHTVLSNTLLFRRWSICGISKLQGWYEFVWLFMNLYRRGEGEELKNF